MASILTTTKQVLNLEASDISFDQDVTMLINAAFSTLNQLGCGPLAGFYITGDTEEWEDIDDLPDDQLHMVKAWVFLKVRMLFDPPGTSYLINALESQMKEFEWRLNMSREYALPPVVVEVVIE